MSTGHSVPPHPTELHQHFYSKFTALALGLLPSFRPHRFRPGFLPVVRRTANVHWTFGSSSPKELRR
jgi:hypothetical protein